MKQNKLFENNMVPEDMETRKAPKEKRGLKLIADFNDKGYAEGWFFAVRKAFKNELDIKYTQRMEPVLDENGKQIYEEFRDKKGNVKLKKDGKPSMRKKTKPFMRWTQGHCYCFAEGHVLYDSPKAYMVWGEALKHFRLGLQIIRAIPCSIDSENQLKEGSVTFTLSKPNDEKTGLNNVGQFHLTQTEFVDFLKTGRSKLEINSLLDSLLDKRY